MRNTVSIVAGLFNSTTDVLADSQAVTMLPNEHLISGVDVHIRQRFAEANAATLGLSSLSKVSELRHNFNGGSDSPCR